MNVVLINKSALMQSRSPAFHAWVSGSRQTACKTAWYWTTRTKGEAGEVQMVPVWRAHAEKFAHPCKRCYGA